MKINLNKSEKRYILIIFFLLAFLLGTLVPRETIEINFDDPNNNSKELNNFIEEYNYILDNFIEEVDEEILLEGALEGVIEKLENEYSTFLDIEENDNFIIQTRGEYEGLGVEITTHEKGIIVMDVFEDSSADKAGIKKGDIFVILDGNSLEGETNEYFVENVRDSVKTKFDVTILRDKEEIELEIEKSRVILSSSKSELIEENDKSIGYITLEIFAANSATQFNENLKELEDKNIDSLIIDLRWNTGGYLHVAENILSSFLDSKNVIYQTESRSNTEKVYSKGNTTKEYDIIVLVNGASASASEVVALGLKESYGASILGEVTYGKGTVQEKKEMDTGTAYKFTTKKWLSPDGNWIDGVGITPDHEVELDSKYYETIDKADDNQLKEAINILKEL